MSQKVILLDKQDDFLIVFIRPPDKWYLNFA